MDEMIPSRLSILGHPQRLAVFRLLMRRYPDRVPAGELAEALGIPLGTVYSRLAQGRKAFKEELERSQARERHGLERARAARSAGGST